MKLWFTILEVDFNDLVNSKTHYSIDIVEDGVNFDFEWLYTLQTSKP